MAATTAFKAVLLVVLVAAVYANSLGGPFVFDDFHVIPSNPAVRGPADIPSFFVDVSKFSVLVGNRDYRPMFLSSMALSWWLGNGSTLPFHLVSIALHAANVLLLFTILNRLFRPENVVSGGLAPPLAGWAAFLAAALFALHPLATESVAYISSQSVPLAAFFYLSSFAAFLFVHARAASYAGSRKWSVLAVSWICFWLALLSKPIAITLPLNLVLWDLILNRSPYTGAASGLRRQLARLAKHVPFAVLAVLYIGVRQLVFSSAPGGGASVRPAIDHYLTETKALVFYYLKLAVAPFGQNVDVAYPVIRSLLDPGVVLAVVVIGCWGALLIVLRRHRNLVFWSAWFFVCLLLTTYGVILGQIVNEHRIYLSLAGLCAVAAYLLAVLWAAFPITVSDFSIGRRSGTVLSSVLIVAILAGLGYQTRARNRIWSSGFELWRDAALNGGTWRAHMNYALALEAKGSGEEALAQFREAVRLGPYAFAHLNLGNALVRRGEVDSGLSHLRTAVRQWPSSPETHFFLGIGLERAGDHAGAEREFRRAIVLRPSYLRAHGYLARYYERRGRKRDAIAALEALGRLEPAKQWIPDKIAALRDRLANPPRAPVTDLFAAGFAHQKAGRRDLAIAAYRRYLGDAPDHVQARFNLGYALMKAGRCGEAVEHFSRAVALRPGYGAAHLHLSRCFAALGDDAKAAEHDARYRKKAGN